MHLFATLLSKSRKTNSRILRLERLEDRSLLTAGMLDPTFGISGKVVTDFPGTDDFANTVAVGSDGKYVVAGNTSNGMSGTDFAVVRYNADGSLDGSFGSGGKQTIDFGLIDSANAVAVQADGSTVVVGEYGDAARHIAVARLMPNGQLDPSFGVGGKQTITFGSDAEGATAVAVRPNGSIVVTGFAFLPADYPTSSDVDYRFAVAQLTPLGQLDALFGQGGKQVIDFDDPSHPSPQFGDFTLSRAFANAVAIQPNGSVIIAGESTGLDMDHSPSPALSEFAAVRLTASGQLDSSFGVGGKTTIDFGPGEDSARNVLLQSDGKIVLTGGSNGNFAVTRLNANGSLDASFGKRTFALSGGIVASGAAMQANGRIIMGGTLYNGSPEIDCAVARVNPDGTLDSTFGTAGTQIIDFGSPDERVNGMAVDANGGIIIAGFSDQSSFAFALARLTGDGIFDPPFVDADGDGIEGSVDQQPAVYSGGFSDIANGGATTGTILSRGQQVIFVQDEPAPDGLRLSAHPLGGGTPASIDIENGAATLSLGAGDQVIATRGSVKLKVVTGAVETTFRSKSGQIVATTSLPVGADVLFKPDAVTFSAAPTSANVEVQFVGVSGQTATAAIVAGTEIGFEAATFSFVAPPDNPAPIAVTLPGGTTLVVEPGQTVNAGSQTVTIDISPESINLDSNGTITVLVYGAADFNVMNISSISFAGATAWQSTLVDANRDGQRDLQLKFRMQDIHDALLSIYSDWLQATYTGSSSSTRDAALLEVTGEMNDQSLFSGSDTATLFLAGKSLKDLLKSLFG